MALMKPILYFLRSSEQKITKDMLHYAFRLDEVNKTLKDFPELEIFEKNYGIYHSDAGLYALVEQKIVGAVWVRKLGEQHKLNGFVDEDTPILNIAIKPEFRDRGVGSAMLEQFLVEAGAVFENLSVSILKDSKAIEFFEKFGFTKVDNADKKSPIDGKDVITMLKKLELKEIQRPTDGYDPRRWMD